MRALAPSTRMRLFCWMALCRKAGPSTMYGRSRSASFYVEFLFCRPDQYAIHIETPILTPVTSTHQILLNLSLRIILKRPIPLKPPFDQLPKLFRKIRRIQMMHPQSTPARFRRVSWSDPLLGGPDTRASEFDLFEPVHDLVETHDEVGSVGDEETVGAIEACGSGGAM